jgi:two-component system OmpR family sensor kinase
MKKESIFFTISITFAVALTLILISFFILLSSNEKREHHFIAKSNMEATKFFLRQYRQSAPTKELRDNLKILNFSLITNKNIQNKILNDKDTHILHIEKKKRHNITIKALNSDAKNYVYISTPYDSFMLLNNNTGPSDKYMLISVFIFIILAFIFLYISTIKKLKPLQTLQKKVQNLANEEFDIDCATTKKDEISLLANEFDKTAKNLKSLKESRNIFIRNIMHELKTPITKGRFLTELEQTQENNLKMQKVFFRLESLINEFASIEELLSSKKALNKKSYFLDDIVDNAIDILMCDEHQIIKNYDNIKIDADFKLFSIALKNLIDNALKYSKDKAVTITTKDKNIIFKNNGDALKYPLENYFEPFFKGDDIRSNQSFGLGLYIIKHILDANGYKLSYSYTNEVNHFTLSCN